MVALTPFDLSDTAAGMKKLAAAALSFNAPVTPAGGDDTPTVSKGVTPVLLTTGGGAVYLPAALPENYPVILIPMVGEGTNSAAAIMPEDGGVLAPGVGGIGIGLISNYGIPVYFVCVEEGTVHTSSNNT